MAAAFLAATLLVSRRLGVSACNHNARAAVVTRSTGYDETGQRLGAIQKTNLSNRVANGYEWIVLLELCSLALRSYSDWMTSRTGRIDIEIPEMPRDQERLV